MLYIRNDTIKLENYNIWREAKKSKEGGGPEGVMILTSKRVANETDFCKPLRECIEVIAVEVKVKGDAIIANIHVFLN